MSEPIPPATVPPPPGPPAAPSARPGNPWDRRAELGYAKAFLDTIVVFVTAPDRAYDETREKGDLAGPLIFAIVLGWIGVVINQAWQSLFGASLLSMMPSEFGDQYGALMFSGVGLIASLLLAPIYILLGLFIGAAILHLCLLLVGGLNASQAGFEGTFRTVSFSSVAQLANVIPIIGGLIATLWILVLYVLGLASLHRTSRGRALVAVLIPVVLCCLCFAAALIFGVGLAAFAIGQQ